MVDARRKITRSIKIPQSIHDLAFATWYKMEKPEYKYVAEALKTAGITPLPTSQTINYWHNHEDWDAHADILDGHIELAEDKEIIKQRQDIIKKMADVGREMVDMGMNYLKEHGIDNSADAIRAIGKGAELEDKLLGWAAYFAELSTSSNEDLDKKLKRFLTGDVIEATATDATESTDDTERPE